MKQHDVAVLFEHIADLLEFRGENPFRIRAYRKAAQSLGNLTEDLDQLHSEDRLLEIPGIGKDLAAKIQEYLATGAIREIEELKRAVPPGIFSMLEIPGIGPKTAKMVWEHLRIGSVDELEAAARAHKLCALPGVREKKEQHILEGIVTDQKGLARRHLGYALPLAARVIELLRGLPGVRRAEMAGSLRRMRETVGDLDVLVTAHKPAAVMAAFIASPFCAKVLASGDTKSSITTADGFQVDLRVVKPSCFGAALVYFTGSKEHNIRLREMAVRKGLKISEYGVFNARTGRCIASRKEEDVYAALGLPWMPPEIREDSGEFEFALKGRLPHLVQIADVRGDFHVHTNWSDGVDSLDAVAEAGKRRGYEYLVITDHSPSLQVARGLTEERKREQIVCVRAINARYRSDYRVLIGAEVDILSDGRMDYPDEVLRQLDFVIGSIHSGFKQPEAVITDRIIRAMENPYVSMIAHPTGRLLGRREPYAVNLDRIFQHAAKTETALEINAFPSRLDLNDRAARRAQRHGARLAVSTDSHRIAHLDHMVIGVGLARRAWLEPRHLLNCLTREELCSWVQRKRHRHA